MISSCFTAVNIRELLTSFKNTKIKGIDWHFYLAHNQFSSEQRKFNFWLWDRFFCLELGLLATLGLSPWSKDKDRPDDLRLSEHAKDLGGRISFPAGADKKRRKLIYLSVILCIIQLCINYTDAHLLLFTFAPNDCTIFASTSVHSMFS